MSAPLTRRRQIAAYAIMAICVVAGIPLAYYFGWWAVLGVIVFDVVLALAARRVARR